MHFSTITHQCWKLVSWAGIPSHGLAPSQKAARKNQSHLVKWLVGSSKFSVGLVASGPGVQGTSIAGVQRSEAEC